MRSRRLVLLLALAACGRPTPPRQAAAAPSAPPPAAATQAVPDKPAEPQWVYSSVGKRDPFRSYLADVSGAAAALVTRCGTPLGRFEVEQLRLVAVITGLEDPVGMVEAPNGVGYALRRGACVGKNGGVVSAVRSGEVIISEWAVRADGSRDATQTVLRLPSDRAPNLEE
jgi:type IV pilus assembly protein PilP